MSFGSSIESGFGLKETGTKRVVRILVVSLLILMAGLVFLSGSAGAAEAENADSCEHIWNDGEETDPPTCSRPGVMTYKCTLCGKVTIGQTPTLPHIEEDIPEVPATCTTEGWSEGKKCAVCGYVIESPAPIPPSPHLYNYTVTKEATCTEEGEEKGTCETCHATCTQAIPALGHSWDEGVVTKVATCTEDGVKKFTCTVCKETKTERFLRPDTPKFMSMQKVRHAQKTGILREQSAQSATQPLRVVR